MSFIQGPKSARNLKKGNNEDEYRYLSFSDRIDGSHSEVILHSGEEGRDGETDVVAVIYFLEQTSWYASFHYVLHHFTATIVPRLICKHHTQCHQIIYIITAYKVFIRLQILASDETIDLYFIQYVLKRSYFRQSVMEQASIKDWVGKNEMAFYELMGKHQS